MLSVAQARIAAVVRGHYQEPQPEQRPTEGITLCTPYSQRYHTELQVVHRCTRQERAPCGGCPVLVKVCGVAGQASVT